jgi:hypothetical protein
VVAFTFTAEGTTATHQLPSFCRGRSRPSRRHQSRTSLTQQSQSTGRRRRRAAEVLRRVLKRPHRALLSLGLEGVLGESGSQSRRFYRVPDGGGAVLTAAIFFGGGGLYTARACAHPPPPPRLGRAPGSYEPGGPRRRKQGRGLHRSRRQPTPLPGLRCGARLARRASPPQAIFLRICFEKRKKTSPARPRICGGRPALYSACANTAGLHTEFYSLHIGICQGAALLISGFAREPRCRRFLLRTFFDAKKRGEYIQPGRQLA